MKLTGLDETSRTKYAQTMVVRFSQETFDRLHAYRESRDASGFIRLAVDLLLAVTESDKSQIESVADELVTSCGTTSDLYYLRRDLCKLCDELHQRVSTIIMEIPRDE